MGRSNRGRLDQLHTLCIVAPSDSGVKERLSVMGRVSSIPDIMIDS